MASDGTHSYTHDANGNLMAAGADSFSWDWADRLASASVNGAMTSYSYAGDGTRVPKISGGTTTPYVWDRAGGLPQLASTGTTTYLQAGGTTEELTASGTPTYDLADALGSTRGVTDGAGALIGAADYDAFGAVRSHAGATSALGYTGEQHDESSVDSGRIVEPSRGRTGACWLVEHFSSGCWPWRARLPSRRAWARVAGSERPDARPAGRASGSQAQSGLSAGQLAGQRVIFSYPGLTVPDALLQQITDGAAAGVIFFRENIASADQIAAVIQQLRGAQRQSPAAAPLLLMTDQEGGLVRRLPGAPEQSEKQIGQAAHPAAAASQAGTSAAQNLAGVGMNVNLAPVLDVYRQPGDFLDQYERSYSDHAQTVTACGQAFIAAQQQAGVAAVAKHFPGLGSATADQNTDAGPVTLPVALASLRAVDEAPYLAAIAAGVQLVMLSWAVYPALDASYPAGLSATVTQGELRGRLGYQGATITDALEAGALDAFGSDAERAVLAARAGLDLILCSARDVSQGQAVTTALADALAGGQLDAADFSAAVDRVTALRFGPTTSRYFPETGHSLSQGFLAYWEQFGGLPVFGYPLTETYTDGQTGVVTQYFERARFEWHPGAWPARYDVELGLLGVELAAQQGLRGTTPFQPLAVASDANCTFYLATGHRLCFGFRDYWNAHGGLEILGLPISEEFEDAATGLTVQYFERQRLEWHAENAPEWQVEGGLLGAELLPGQH